LLTCSSKTFQGAGVERARLVLLGWLKLLEKTAPNLGAAFFIGRLLLDV
jgi:hypothetical protein